LPHAEAAEPAAGGDLVASLSEVVEAAHANQTPPRTLITCFESEPLLALRMTNVIEKVWKRRPKPAVLPVEAALHLGPAALPLALGMAAKKVKNGAVLIALGGQAATTGALLVTAADRRRAARENR
jgi:hypothetical protein